MKLGLGLGLNKYKSNQPSESFLLDDYSGAAAAYSLRYLSSSYTGDVILVRRSSDNVEEGFTPAEVTDGTLVSFCGVGNGFVKTVYDQINSSNWIQTNNANQPQIVSSGSLITVNGKPAIDFISANSTRFSISPVISDNQPLSIFMVSQRKSSGSTGFTISNTTSIGAPMALWIFSNNSIFFKYSQGELSSVFDNNNQLLLSGIGLASEASIHANGSLVTSTLGGSGSTLDFNMAGGRAAVYSNAYFQEIIFFNADQSANRTAIETAINSYYSIY